MMEASSGIELQRRWSGSALLHPMAHVGAGQMTNAYRYFLYPKTGGRTLRSDDSNTAAYVTAGGGAELNVSSGGSLPPSVETFCGNASQLQRCDERHFASE